MTDLCSRAWDDRTAWGTATPAGFWLALEQPGPWGAKAFTESRLDPTVGRALERACADAGGRALLMRSPGPHAATGEGPRRILLAGGPITDPWLVAANVDDPTTLLDLPFDRLAGSPAPELPPFTPAPPAVLVCTNGRRDTCCAVRGRPVASTAASVRPGQVWECSHTGGHRFAPTALVLPTMQLLAHATPHDVVTSLQAAELGEIAVRGPGDRGQSRRGALEQVAESFVRAQHGVVGLADLATASGPGADLVTVTHRDGRSWRLRVTSTTTGEALPESCGKEPKPVTRWRVGDAGA